MGKARFMPGRAVYGFTARATRVNRQNSSNPEYSEQIKHSARVVVAVASAIGVILGLVITNI